MIEFRNVSISYGKKEVVHNVSFTLPDIGSLVILGPNGCGKTTILRAFAGLIPYSGSILLDGKEIRDIKKDEMAKKVAYLGQMMHGDFTYTVEETVLMGCYAHMHKGWFMQMSDRERKKVNKILKQMDLEGVKDRPITQLSGGQLQRVFLARTFAQEPNYILLDEPTNHMDFRYQKELQEYLLAWEQEEGHTLIGVFHDVSIAAKLADFYLMIREGNVISFGKEIVTPKLLEETFGFDFVEYLNETYHTFIRKMIKMIDL